MQGWGDDDDVGRYFLREEWGKVFFGLAIVQVPGLGLKGRDGNCEKRGDPKKNGGSRLQLYLVQKGVQLLRQPSAAADRTSITSHALGDDAYVSRFRRAFNLIEVYFNGYEVGRLNTQFYDRVRQCHVWELTIQHDEASFGQSNHGEQVSSRCEEVLFRKKTSLLALVLDLLQGHAGRRENRGGGSKGSQG